MRKKVTDILEMLRGSDGEATARAGDAAEVGARQPQRSAVFDLSDVPPDDLGRLIQTLQDEMHDAATRPPVRGGGAPARRDQRAQARAPRRRLIDRVTLRLVDVHHVAPSDVDALVTLVRETGTPDHGGRGRDVRRLRPRARPR